MECQDARNRIQAYLDGELVEAQAAPLRKHLLDCQPCRAGAQSEKNLKRWFVEQKSVAVPRDFSARVARRAFAGDRGERFNEPTTIHATRVNGPRSMAMTVGSGPDERNLRFVLTLTAAAAVVLLLMSVAIRSLTLPSGSRLMAEPTMSIDEANRSLDRLNQPAPNAEHAPVDAPKKVVEHKQ